MPTLLRVGPYRFFFFSNEGREPAHVHVEAGNSEAKFWLASGELASSYGFKPHELNELLNIVASNRTAFLEAWNEHFPGKA